MVWRLVPVSSVPGCQGEILDLLPVQYCTVSHTLISGRADSGEKLFSVLLAPHVSALRARTAATPSDKIMRYWIVRYLILRLSSRQWQWRLPPAHACNACASNLRCMFIRGCAAAVQTVPQSNTLKAPFPFPQATLPGFNTAYRISVEANLHFSKRTRKPESYP